MNKSSDRSNTKILATNAIQYTLSLVCKILENKWQVNYCDIKIGVYNFNQFNECNLYSKLQYNTITVRRKAIFPGVNRGGTHKF